MIDSFLTFFTSTQHPFFWTSASLGTTLFLLRLLMSLFGVGFFEHDADIDTLHDGLHHDSPFFKCLTIHSLSGFLMIFGWVGLACNMQFKMPTGFSLLIALACGLAMLVITAFIMHAAMSLEGSGSVFSIQKTIGLIGSVSQRIPAHGQGKVQLTIDNTTREILAQSYNKKTIQSFTVVKVIKALDHEIIEVIELEEKPL